MEIASDAYRMEGSYSEAANNGAFPTLGETDYFSGCNIYYGQSVIRQMLDWTPSAGDVQWVHDAKFRDAFIERFQPLPFFAPTRSGDRSLAGCFNGPHGARLDELLLQAILAIEEAAAVSMRKFAPIHYASAAQTEEQSVLVWQSSSPKLSRAAAEIALSGILELLPDHAATENGRHPYDFDGALEQLFRRARSRRMLDTPSLVKYVAQQRGLPVQTLGPDKMRIGQGRHQRHVIASMTDDTSVIAQKFCLDKRLANRGLRDLGLPVPRQIKVTSAEDALDACKRLGGAVVIKPSRRSNGLGVTVDIHEAYDIDAAFRSARTHGAEVVVEEFIPGSVHRLLVVAGRFSAALRFQRPEVIGDGRRTIAELIEELNTDPRRDGIRVKKVKIDIEVEATLQRLGLDIASIPPVGERVVLRTITSMATGAMSVDCTDIVHQDNRDLAERAVQAFGSLAAAGLDYATVDVSRSYRDVDGRIVEINGSPGLLMHKWPGEGTSRDMAAKVLDLMYPMQDNGRIPIAVFGGDRGIGAPARMLDAILRKCGRASGLSLREEAYVNGRQAAPPAGRSRVLPTHLAQNLEVDTLVAAMSLRRIARRGLDIDTCMVSIVLDRNKEGSADDFHMGVTVLDRATTDAFVVGAGNQLALEYLRSIGDRKLILVADRSTDPLVQAHLSRGGTVVADAWADGENQFVVLSGSEEVGHVRLGDVWRQLSKGRARRMRQATKYAVAAALGLDIPVSRISTAVTTVAATDEFGTSMEQP